MREKGLQMQETGDLEIGGVMEKLVNSSPKALEHDLEEGLFILCIGLSAAGSGRDAGG